jgi:hypothetical protein
MMPTARRDDRMPLEIIVAPLEFAKDGTDEVDKIEHPLIGNFVKHLSTIATALHDSTGLHLGQVL